MEKVNKQEEIDLLKLFLKGVNIFRANFWMIVLFFLIGIALGFSSYYSSRKIYENKMLVSSSILTKSYTKNLFDVLNRHKREGNFKGLSNLLGISEKTAAEISFITIEGVSEIDANKESDRFI